MGRAKALTLLALIVAAALWLRLGGLGWDDATYPHPDERYMTMVATALHGGVAMPPGGTNEERAARSAICATRYPAGAPADWFDSACSGFNPANVGHAAYPYGLLPLATVRLVAQGVGQWVHDPTLARYGGIHVVGRAFSALCDVLTLLATFVLGRLLWNRSVGLLAATLYALAVLPIQASHFFTVDAALTLGATAALVFLVRLARFGERADAAAFGVAFGLALACKISIAPLALLLPIAAAFAPSRASFSRRPDLATRAAVRLPEIALAAIAAFVTFRIAAPNAFAGPAWYDVAPSSVYVDQAIASMRLASGEVDIPPNWQWLGRSRWLFAARNLLVWGLGPALGLAAIAALVGVGIDALRRGRRHRARLVAWTFAVGYFLLMGGQWVATMRYLLPIYPVLCVLVAGWLVSRARRRRRARASFGRIASRLPALAVVACTGVWALAFHHIHTTLHPYVAATHWMLRTIAAPVSSTMSVPGRPLVNWPAAGRFGDDVPPTRAAATRAPASGTIDRLHLHHVIRERDDTDPRIAIRVLDAAGRLVAEVPSTRIPFAAGAPAVHDVELPLVHPAHLLGGESYQVQVTVRDGTLELAGSSIAQEGAWNDTVPMRVPWLPAGAFDASGPSGTALRGIDWVDAFAEGYYAPIDLGIAAEDDAAKRARLIDGLDRAEWLIVPNGRFFDSVRRNPLRFPLTTRFYDALFQGDLGFTRVAVFASPPTLAGLAIDDQALPSAGEKVTTRPGLAWAAEEAFSVYDHPGVHVFHRNAATTKASIAAVLEGVGVIDVHEAARAQAPLGASRLSWSTREAALAPDALLAPSGPDSGGDADALDAQPRTALAQLMYVVVWYTLALVLALVAWPWLAALWPDLPDRGYGVARIAGLLALAVPAWWLASLGVDAWSGRGLSMLFLALVVFTAFFARRLVRRARIDAGIARIAVRLETAFVVLFIAGVALRLIDPDLWAPGLGGEKPMDFALFRGVLQAGAFPPTDPWFAGGRVNYYYFGFVLAGTLAKLGATPASIAYNLALPLWFAMTGVAACAIAFDAAAAWRRTSGLRSAWMGGASALVACVLLGNLDLPRALVPGAVAAVRVAAAATGATPAGIAGAFAQDPVRWFWAPTRTVAERAGASYEVNEFPAFTFLFGDLHAHWLALPLQLLMLCALLAIATAWLAGRRSIGRWIALVAALALPVGLLRATNTWDWPLYLVMASTAAALVAWRAGPLLVAAPRHPILTQRVAWAVAAVAWLVVAQALVTWPFRGFVTGEVVLRPFTGMRTPLLAWLAMQGWFVIVTVAFAASLPSGTVGVGSRRAAFARALRGVAIVGIATTLIAALLSVAGHVAEPPAIGVQVALAAWLAATFIERARAPLERAALAAAIVGFGLDLVVEFVVVGRDLGRMNTYFKAHMQSWILLSVASGMMIASLLEHPLSRRASVAWRGAVGVATLVAAAYLPFAIVGRAHTRFDGWTGWSLDGEAFLAHAVFEFDGRRLPLADDARLIAWLRKHAKPADVVLEAQLPEYRWGSRISAFTSRQTVLGYRFHESQQRPLEALGEVVELRRRNVAAMYASTDAQRVMAALVHYRIRYVVVGALERAVYPADGLAKFGALAASGAIAIAYQAGDDVIYRVPTPGDPPSAAF